MTPYPYGPRQRTKVLVANYFTHEQIHAGVEIQAGPQLLEIES